MNLQELADCINEALANNPPDTQVVLHEDDAAEGEFIALHYLLSEWQS